MPPNKPTTPEQKARYAAATRAARAGDPEKYRQRDRDRQGPERRAQSRASNERNVDAVRERNHRNYVENGPALRAAVIAWKARHPERRAAHRAVEKAIRQGVLVRPSTCQTCGKDCRPDAAHTDYNKPLDVLWLCRRCHMRMDKDPERGDRDEPSTAAS